MGTTQRLIPGVTGEPNWSNLSNAITALANTVEKEIDIADQAEDALDTERENPSEDNKKTVEKIAVQQKKLQGRKQRHFNSALKNLVRTGGGRSKIVKGQSSSLGRAGIRVSTRIAGFVTGVYTDGLGEVLRRIGFGPLTGKTVSEVIDFLLIYFADVSSGMDEVAANMASCQALQEISKDVNSIEELEQKLDSLIEENTLTQLTCLFYGIYLFEHLAQRFEEKITQLKGFAVSKETFTMIRQDTINRVKELSQKRELSGIDWRGREGKQIQETIFDSIIQIFE